MIPYFVYSDEPSGNGCMVLNTYDCEWFIEDCNDEFDFVCEFTLTECKYALMYFVLFELKEHVHKCTR